MSNSASSEDSILVANVRRLSGVPANTGPSDKSVLSAVRGFAAAFDYWYIRVMREAVGEYRKLIIARINPFIRRMECDGKTCIETADRLVEDYNARNFVTAGGWALEEMAVRIGERCQKGAAEGIDIQRYDPESGDYHLYVLKSGLVTRNSDIVNALKRNARQTEKLLLQGRSTGRVIANYAIAAGKTTSTFEDGIRRPSSAEFWSELTGLPQEQAVELVLAVAAEAGRLVRRDAADHLASMKLLIATYIELPGHPATVDWDFLAMRSMQVAEVWVAEDKRRHQTALEQLRRTGYKIERRVRAPVPEKKPRKKK